MTATLELYSWSRTRRLIREDIAFRCAYENKTMTRGTMIRMLVNPGVSSTVRYRLQCFFQSNGLGWIGRFLKYVNLTLHGIEIDGTARIGGGFCISHPVSILILGDVIIGERCLLFHQNTICSSPFLELEAASGPVVIGNDVTFGGGSCAYGPIEVGDGCRIGSNTVVDRSFPAGSVLFGVPARPIGKTASTKDAE